MDGVHLASGVRRALDNCVPPARCVQHTRAACKLRRRARVSAPLPRGRRAAAVDRGPDIARVVVLYARREQFRYVILLVFVFSPWRG